MLSSELLSDKAYFLLQSQIRNVVQLSCVVTLLVVFGYEKERPKEKERG